MKHKAKNIGNNFGYIYRGLLIAKSFTNAGRGHSNYTPHDSWGIKDADLFGGDLVPKDMIRGAGSKKDAMKIIDNYFDLNGDQS